MDGTGARRQNGGIKSPLRQGGFMISPRTLVLAPILAAALAIPAQSAEMIIGFGAGGGYDTWGRTLARHIGNHMPGKPSFINKNMPGAGSVKAANYLYNVAAKDGSVIGIIARDAALIPISDPSAAKFDARKFAWIGSPTGETNVCIAMASAPAKTVQELFEKELIVGDTGVGTGTHTYPKVLNALLGTKFRIIGGYKSSVDVMLAMERGEVHGSCESYDSVMSKKPKEVAEGKIKLLFQAGAEKNPHVNAPFIFDFAKTEEQKKALRFVYAGQGIGRPFVGPPGMSSETTAMLQKAFDATMKDPAFLADTKKQKLDVEPVTGQRLQQIINELYATPKPIIDKIADILGKKKS